MLIKSNKINTLTRRHFIGGMGAVVTLAISPAAITRPLNQKLEYWVSAQGATVDAYGLGWVHKNSNPVKSSIAINSVVSTLTGFRGHGAVQHPLKTASVIMFARRPGVQGVEINLKTGSVEGGFKCEADRHLFGHGCFSADGKILFTSEADYKKGTGKIGIRDALNYQLLGEYESHGIGPHEIKLLPDGNTLVVANGGILTHPDSGRKKLNLDTMVSTLTYIDVANGQKIDDFQLPESKASIRHLDVSADGTVAFALQVQRNVVTHGKTLALAGVHKPGGAIKLFNKPETVIEQMDDYMGSVVINNHSRLVGFTSPRGNLAAFWHLDSNDFVGYHQLRDVCGIAVSSDQKHFVISNSFGQLRQIDAYTLQENTVNRLSFPNMRWDNHLFVASAV